MSDVTRVTGPLQPPEPSKPKKESGETERFKEVYSKVEKVEETYREQPKKKRAKRGEEEVEEKAEEPGATTLKSPLGAQRPGVDQSLFAVEKPTTAPPTFTPPSSTTASGAAVNSDLWEEESSDERVFSEERFYTAPPPPVFPSIEPPPKEEVKEKAPPRRKEREPLPSEGAMHAKRKSSQKGRLVESTGMRKQKEEAGLPSETAPGRKEEKEAYFKEMAKKKEELADEAALDEELLFLPTAAGALEKKKEEIEETMAPAVTPLAAPGFIEVPIPSPAEAYYVKLSPEFFELFEKMVGVMTVLNTSGQTETTIFLNDPKYKSSLFYETKIIIREYSTAPKVFNIELITPNDETLALIQANRNNLMAAFQTGDYAFKVNRLEPRVERPMVSRKGKASREKEEK